MTSKGTTTTELTCLLSKCLASSQQVKPLGVFAADQVPYEQLLAARTSRGTFLPRAFIVNTDKATQPGEHWVAFLFRSDGQLEYFDSYGLPISAYPNVHGSLPSSIPIAVRNTVCLQSLDTFSCGDYCIFFLSSRAHAISFSRFVSSLRLKPNGASHSRDLHVESTVAKLRGAVPCLPMCCLGIEQCCTTRVCLDKNRSSISGCCC